MLRRQKFPINIISRDVLKTTVSMKNDLQIKVQNKKPHGRNIKISSIRSQFKKSLNSV